MMLSKSDDTETSDSVSHNRPSVDSAADLERRLNELSTATVAPPVQTPSVPPPITAVDSKPAAVAVPKGTNPLLVRYFIGMSLNR